MQPAKFYIHTLTHHNTLGHLRLPNPSSKYGGYWLMATVLKKAVASLDKNMVLRSIGEILENVTVVLLKVFVFSAFM